MLDGVFVPRFFVRFNKKSVNQSNSSPDASVGCFLEHSIVAFPDLDDPILGCEHFSFFCKEALSDSDLSCLHAFKSRPLVSFFFLCQIASLLFANQF